MGTEIVLSCDVLYWFGLVWFGFMAYQPLMSNHFYTYIKYMINEHILKITILNKPEFVSCTLLNSST